MEYPLIINGEARGSFRCEQAGLYTLMEAELAGVGEGLYRLWVHGGGKCAYLGLMQPWSGGMYLRRRFSRRELMGFPERIEYASDEDNSSLHNATEPADRPAGEEPPEEPRQEPASALSCPYPAPVPEEGEELQWFRRPDGSLVAFDGISTLVALPARLRGDARGAALRRIEDKEYMVFRY